MRVLCATASILRLALGCTGEQGQTSYSTSASHGSTTSTGSDPVWTARCRDGWCLIPAGTFVIGSPETEWGRGAYSEDQVQVTDPHLRNATTRGHNLGMDGDRLD